MNREEQPAGPAWGRRLVLAGRAAGWVLAVAGIAVMYRGWRAGQHHDLWWLMIGAYALLVVLAAMGSAMARWREAEIDAEGIAVGRRRVRWSEVTGIEIREHGATIHAVVGDLDLARLPQSQWYAYEAEARWEASRGEPAPGPGGAVAGDEVNGWLGLEPGAALSCEVSAGWRQRLFLNALSHGMWLVPPYFFITDQLEPSHPFTLLKWFLFALPLLYGAPYFRAPYPCRILASRDGLALAYEEAGLGASGWHQAWYPWDCLRRERDGVVTSTRGSFCIVPGMAHRDRLLAGIRAAIAAREQGLRLPAGGEAVPETALSRSSGGIDEAERGISVAAV